MHLEAGPWPALDGADADPSHLVRVFLELWLVDLHEINSLSSGGKYNTHNPYCYALACMCDIDGLWSRTQEDGYVCVLEREGEGDRE